MTGRSAGAVPHKAVRGPRKAVSGPLGAVAGLAALLVVVLGVLFAGDSGPTAVDARVWAVVGGAVVGGVGAPWRDVALAVDFLGEPVGAVVLVAGAVGGCLLLRRPRAAVLVVAGVGLGVGATKLLKPVVGRTIHGAENLSFPSGHTAFLTAFALVVALLLTGRSGLRATAGTSLVVAAGLVAGGAMGWAQVVLSAHYPTDVVGGWCTAMAVVPATAWLVDRAADRPVDRGVDAPRGDRC
ncbi:phosphatase PAP2 family protein [Streptomyces wedmorensis]|uniref:Phosphatase PAP2 family protein n=1 Tax=Streptomyces wedmorensis TaxID=43759 RepID=A0ABW6IUX7_STRWE